jgi:hypothetical protein
MILDEFLIVVLSIGRRILVIILPTTGILSINPSG